jgi:hypothetical protein
VAEAAEHDQPALVVGAQLAQGHRRAEERAGVERVAARLAAGDRTLAGVDDRESRSSTPALRLPRPV